VRPKAAPGDRLVPAASFDVVPARERRSKLGSAKEARMIILTDRLRLRPMKRKDIADFVRHLNDWDVQHG
jgi:hypothetical protein